MPDDDTIRYSQLLNRLVIDLETTEGLGHVDTLLVDLKQSQIEGIVCRTGFLGREKLTFAWAQLENIGEDSLVVRSQTEAGRRQLAAAQPVIGLEIWTDTGNQAGHIADYELNRQTGEVIQYLFALGGMRELTEGLYGLSPDSILSAGRKRMMVTAGAVERAEPATAGLTQKATQATEFLKADYAQTRQDWKSWVQGAQVLADKVQQHTQKLKDYTQEHLPELTDQVQDKAQQVRDQVQKRVSQAKDRLNQSGLTTPFESDSSSPEAIDIQSFEVWEEDEADPPRPQDSNASSKP
jgi:sporulation protein YlmC with PRC-barrel domain/vacuolar-type H+-ATPase subunit H